MRNSLSQSSNNFEDIDKQYAYMIWVVEHEFHVGPITEDFPLMKFLNYWDEYNLNRWKEDCTKDTSSTGEVKTFN